MATKKTNPVSKATPVKAAAVTKPAAKPAVTKPAVTKPAVTKPAVTKPVSASPFAKKAPARATAPKAAAPKAPAAKATATNPKAPTVVVAVFDVGFGNSLSIRGEGAGLSWESGVLMACEGASEWVFAAPSGAALTFKVLINDAVWSAGADFVAPAGQTTIISPEF